MRTALFLAALALVASPAQAAANRPACPSGQLQQVRVSEILPKGSLEGFRAALAEHSRWYVRNGYPQDRFVLSQVVYESGSKRRAGKSGVKVMILHSPVSEVPRDKQDDGWKAFVAKYKANSRIVSTTVTCTRISAGQTASAITLQRLAR